MNLMKALQKEADKMENRLATLRSAISALSGNSRNGRKKHALKGRHMSAAHRAAIKAGWAKRRKLKLRALA